MVALGCRGVAQMDHTGSVVRYPRTGSDILGGSLSDPTSVTGTATPQFTLYWSEEGTQRTMSPAEASMDCEGRLNVRRQLRVGEGLVVNKKATRSDAID